MSRSKRSKINSFIPLVEHLDRLLKFPTAIPEKLGLDLSRRLQEDHRFVPALFATLQEPPVASAEDELARLSAALERAPTKDRYMTEQPAEAPPAPQSDPGTGPLPRITAMDRSGVAARLKDAVSLQYDAEAGRIELTGGGVGPDLFRALQAWLKTR